jgi:hypothetical protein
VKTCATGITTTYIDDSGETEAVDERLGPYDGLENHIPAGCIKIEVAGCIIYIGPVGGGGVNELGAYDDSTGIVKFVNVTVPFSTNGGFFCPAAGNGTFNAEYGPVENAGGVILRDFS